MDGNQQHLSSKDPFVTGQFLGMLTILMFIEQNNGINKDFLYKLKQAVADKSADGLDKPTEDIFLIVEEMVKKIK